MKLCCGSSQTHTQPPPRAPSGWEQLFLMDPSMESVLEQCCSSTEPLTEAAQQELKPLPDHGQTVLMELSNFEEKHSTLMQRKRKSISSLNSPKKNAGRIYVACDLSCADTHFWWMKCSRRRAQLCHSWSTTVTLAQLSPRLNLCCVSAWPVPQLVPRQRRKSSSGKQSAGIQDKNDGSG